jgi:hypothetical protein
MANVFDLRDQEKLEDRLRCSYTAIYDPAYVVIMIACLSAKERRDHTRRKNTFQRFSVPIEKMEEILLLHLLSLGI